MTEPVVTEEDKAKATFLVDDMQNDWSDSVEKIAQALAQEREAERKRAEILAKALEYYLKTYPRGFNFEEIAQKALAAYKSALSSGEKEK